MHQSNVPQLRFKDKNGNDYPDWGKKQINDLTDKSKKYGIVDGPFGSNLKTIHYRSEGVPIISSGFVTKGYFKADRYLYVSLEKYKKEKRSSVSGGDIIMAKIGANCGSSAILPTEHEDSILSGNALKISIDKNRFSTFFIWSLLHYLYKTNKLEKLKSVGAQPAISMVGLKKLVISVPLYNEQLKIASFLTPVDSKIEKLTRKKELLEEYKKGVMQKLFSGEIRFKDENGDNYPDWEEKKLDKVGKFVGGGTPPTEVKDYWQGGIVWYTPSEINKKYKNQSKRKLSEVGLKNSSAKLIPSGSLAVTTRATIGHIAISQIDFSTNQGFQSITTNENHNNEFIYYLLIHFKNKLLRIAQGSTFLEVYAKDLKKIRFKFPVLEQQIKISTFLSSIDSKIENISLQIDKNKEFKKGLLQQMFV